MTGISNAWSMVALAGLLSACQADLSFKSTTIEKVNRDQAFDAALAVVANHFYQNKIVQDREQGQIQTDYIFKGNDPLYRQKVWIGVADSGTESVRIEVLAPIEKTDMRSNALQWELLGSDVKVEKFLLDRIVERILGAPPPMEAEEQGPPVVDG